MIGRFEILSHKVPRVVMTGPSTEEPLDKPIEEIIAEKGIAAGAWEMFGRWLDNYRVEHPNDNRSDYDLITVYSDAMNDNEVSQATQSEA